MAMLVLVLYVGAVQPDGVSPLWIASQNGHVEVVRALLGAGADVGQAMVSWGMQRGGVCVWAMAQCSELLMRCVVRCMCGLVGVVRWVC